MTMAVRATLEIARQTLRLLLQNRLLWLFGLGLLALPVIGYALVPVIEERHEVQGRENYAVTTWQLVAFLLMPWTTLYFGVQAVHGDIEDRTFQYLFLRPVPRASILLGKWLAVAGMCALLCTLAAGMWFVGFALRSSLWPEGLELDLLVAFVAAIAMGTIAYAAVAVFFAARFRRPLVWGAMFIVGLQMILGGLPSRAGIRYLTITDPLRRFLLEWLEPDRRLAQQLWRLERDFDPRMIGQPVLNLAIITAVALSLALFVYARAEYDSRERE